MNYKILFSTIFISTSFIANAQYGAQTFAITGNSAGDYSWRNIRQIDLTSGQVVKDIFVSGTNVRFLDAVSNRELTAADIQKISTNDLVAASAFDIRTSRLFYSTMHSGQLRWIDMNDKSPLMSVYTKQQQFVSSPDITDESINITRMCIGADGYGYALTNDGNHLYRFSTDNIPVVTDLGNLVDAESNQGFSVHNKCSSWGGDMIADAFGKLYVITATRSVFSIDVNSRIASLLGSITGLPGTYTTNGAVVDDNGDIVVNSSTGKDGYYKVKFPELTATKIEGSDKTYSISDLANSNLLLQKQADAAKSFGSPAVQTTTSLSGGGHIYPNPAPKSFFNVSFDGLKTGRYLITVTDLSGKSILNRSVDIGVKGQIETVNVTPSLAVGMYLVKVESDDKSNAFTEKMIIK